MFEVCQVCQAWSIIISSALECYADGALKKLAFRLEIVNIVINQTDVSRALALATPSFFIRKGGTAMKKRKICITQQDQARLEELLLTAGNERERADLAEMAAEINRASVVEASRIPASVVTMHSKVKLQDLDTGEKMVFTLVFPDEANIEAGKISVISPIGTAILGYAAGDEIAWKVPAGTRRIKIEEVLFQPEAAGEH